MLDLLRSCRPKQWLKNLIVFAAPAAAGVLGKGNTFGRVAASLAAFVLTASGLYLLNDVADIESDRAHPRKRMRPIAAGRVSVFAARATAAVAIAAGLGIGLAIRPLVCGLIALYVVLTLLYTYGLKHEEVVDILIVASGFLLRAGAGAAAADVPVSSWFLTVMTFGALLLASGKRSSELQRAGDEASQARPVLSGYSERYLEHVGVIATAGSLIGYALWAFDRHETLGGRHTWLFDLSVLPFAGAMLRYLLLIDSGVTEAPEDALFTDRILLLFGIAWAAVFLAAVWSIP